MNPTLIAAVEDTQPVDGDLAEQAVPGHGVPSQDPNPAAQQTLTPAESDRESKSALMGGGMIAGVAAGAAVGAAVGGPVGVLVGGTAGAIVGALGGAGVGQVIEPEPPTDAASDASKPVYVENPKAQV